MSRKICECKAGKNVIIETMNLDAASTKRLNDMGVYPGAMVEVVNNQAGRMVVGAGELRVILEHTVSDKITVS